MDSNMSTAAYVHRSPSGTTSSASSACSTSSSPGMMSASNGNNTLGGAAAAAAAAAGGGGGGRMAVIGMTRSVKLRRRGASGFGFSLRGGREYGAGFYVSDVVPGGEAHRNGLRVGDQILRVNGYPVEDAVHQEVALLAKNQQVLVLKIRSVGMIPVKDNPNDPVTWHMVQQQQQQLQYGDAISNEIRIRVLVGEKGRLGCGVCRGLVPGLTVQGTREGGPARAAGLKAGDVILWCNGQSLTDLPFERAIESMRNAAILDLIVNRPLAPLALPNNHVYDCPEALWMRGSTGYDSDSSSLVGPSPPPPPPSLVAGSMQMLASSPQHRQIDPRMMQQGCNRNGRNCCPPNGSGPSDWGHMEQSQEWTRKANNTTVIRITQQQQQQAPPLPYGGTLRPSQSHQHQQQHARRGSDGGAAPRMPPLMMRSLYDEATTEPPDEEPLYDPVPPKDYESHDFDANPRDEIDRRAEYRREHGISEFEAGADDGFVKENGQTESVNGALSGSQRQLDKKTVTTVEVHQTCPPAPPSMPPAMPYKWPAEAKPMNAMGLQMGSTMSMGSTGSTETESSLESSCGGKDCGASTSSSLSTSSSCEQQHPSPLLLLPPVAPPASTSPASVFANSIAAAAASVKLPAPTVLDAQVQVHVQAQQPGRLVGGGGGGGTLKAVPPPPPPPPIDLGTAITQELQRRAKQRSMNNAAQEASAADKQQQQSEARKPQNPEALRAQEQKVTHDKLMEEFKRAHQRMFSNTQQRSQEQSTEQNEEKRTNSTATSLKPAASSTNLTKTNNNNNTISNNNKNQNSNKPNDNDERVEMKSIESIKFKDSPASNKHVPKPTSTYFLSSNTSTTTSSTISNPIITNSIKVTSFSTSTSTSTSTTTLLKPKPKPHVTISASSTTTLAKPTPKPKPNLTVTSSATAATLTKPVTKPKPNVTITSAAGPGKAVSKVAIRIGTYNETDAKQPSRLGFLNGGRCNGEDSPKSGRVASRLHNELAATLQRSNLRKKTEGENEVPIATDEANNKANQENGQLVDKLATSLNNKVTIRINPEASSR